ETYHAQLTTTLAADNTPENATVTLEERLETDLFRPAFTTGALDASNGTVDATVADMSGVEQLVVANVDYMRGAQTIAPRAPHPADPTSIHITTYLVSLVSDIALASGTVTWTEDATGGYVHAIVVAVNTPTVNHTIAAPYSPSLKIPELPAKYAQYNLASA